MPRSVSAAEAHPVRDGRESRPDALQRLPATIYGELRELAQRLMRGESPGHTLQPTALVHEAYLRLTEQDRVHWRNRNHVLGVAAQLMRRVLVDHARAHKAAKRGGAETRVPLDEAVASVTGGSVDLLDLDDALNHLAELDPRQARIVDLRYFGGLSIEDTAEVMSLSPATVKREWQMARAWLHRALRPGP